MKVDKIEKGCRLNAFVLIGNFPRGLSKFSNLLHRSNFAVFEPGLELIVSHFGQGLLTNWAQKNHLGPI